MSETLSETRDVNTCPVGSGLVRSGPVRVRLVEFGLISAQHPVFHSWHDGTGLDSFILPSRLVVRPSAGLYSVQERCTKVRGGGVLTPRKCARKLPGISSSLQDLGLFLLRHLIFLCSITRQNKRAELSQR